MQIKPRNIYKLLSKELEEKDWPDSLKERYLYLRICELFIYDHRFLYSSTSYQDELCMKKIDLEHVMDNQVVCIPWVKEVYKPLREELLHRRTEIIGTGHLKAYLPEEKIIADACIGSDLTRAKMKIHTNGYNPINEERNIEFQKELQESDRKIGHIKDDYMDTFLAQAISEVKTAFYLGCLEGKYKKAEYLIFKLQKFKELYAKFPNITSYSDMRYLKHYLANKLFKEERSAQKLESCYLHQGEDETLTFMEIDSFLDIEKYFLFRQIGESAEFKEITRQDVIEYKKSFEPDKINRRG